MISPTWKVKEKASYNIASKFRYLNEIPVAVLMQMTSANKCLEISSLAASFEILKIIFDSILIDIELLELSMKSKFSEDFLI